MKLLMIAVLALGCSKKSDKKNEPPPSVQPTPSAKPSVAPMAECDPVKEGQICNYLQCGGNSQVINSFPIQGIRPNGDCNVENMQMMPESMKGETAGPCDGMTLNVDKDPTDPEGKRLVLIGKSATGTCKDKQLEGVSFDIRTTKGTESIKIEEVTTYPTPNQKTYPAYRLIWKDNNGAKTALCAKGGQELRKKLGADYVKWGDTIPNPDHELVVPIVSELYTETGNAVDPAQQKWVDKSLEWIHLACVDDALAKRTFYDQLSNDKERSRAALRMWTADYCGGRPFTVRGKMIDFATSTKDWESQWTSKGAKCLTKPRIIYENGVEVVPTKQTQMIKEFCGLSQSDHDCKQIKTWIDEAKNCRKDYIDDKTRAGTLPDCPTCTAADACSFETHNK